MSTLYLVATPIGNLKDITLRALDVLNGVDIIACEDTRHSAVLLNHYNIKKPLISYHKHNERGRTEEIIKHLEKGQNVAIITDAGTPCISDPGALVVNEARDKGYKIEVIPGASAVISAVSLAGLQSSFAFIGFIPEKKKLREEMLGKYELLDIPLIFYSSPHNINNDGKNLYELLGNRKAYVIKELTKIYESVIQLELKDFPIENPKGEFVIIVMPAEKDDSMNSLTIKEHILELMNTQGINKKEAIKLVAKMRGINKNIVYQEGIGIDED